MAEGIRLTGYKQPPKRRKRRRSRRNRLLTRTLPLIVVAAAGLAFGMYEAGAAGRAERALVTRYVSDWVHGNYPAMYALLSPAAKQQIGATAFTNDYVKASATATTTSLHAGNSITITGNIAREPVTVHTSVFGQLHEQLRLPLNGDGLHVGWTPTMVFPGLLPGERLTRTSSLGTRGNLLAANGQVLAQGPNLTSPIPTVAGEVVGNLGPISPTAATAYAAEGYPANAQVGQDGLELIFQNQLAGRPGGTLLAGTRILAQDLPINGQTVRTTINPQLELDALNVIGNSYAGMTVMNPRTGAIEAAVGLAFTAAQPPGSTFKIITATAVLQDGLATPSTQFPYMASATLDGYQLKNAGNEVCGGSLTNAFATSCNSTYAPLGAQLGAVRLLSTAVKYGFNQSTGIPTALESTVPPSSLGSALQDGSAAIGQDQDQATTLQMADVGATIADHGRRPIPTLLYGAKPRFVTVTTPLVAADLQAMMVAVVEYGTGVTAQIPGIQVAGKTGTAELANTGNKKNDKKETDGWFVGYAPVAHPRLVVCALYPAAGYGEQTAAPAARQMFVAALTG
jgi:hypothetical protein